MSSIDDVLGLCCPLCEICGARATCFGVYEQPDDDPRYACDRCCGHGNEDGWCKRVSEGGISDAPRGVVRWPGCE